MRLSTLIHRVFSVTIAAWVITASGFGQQVNLISIRVLDSQGAAVASARVVVYPQGASSAIPCELTESALCKAVLPSGGTFVIEVDARGFRRSSKIVSVSPGQTLSETISLEVAGVDSSVVVTAAAGAQTFDQTAKAVTTVDSEEIVNRGEYTLSGIISTTPGIFVRGSGGPGELTQLRIRGLRPDALAVLIDGMRFRDAATAQADSSSFMSNLNFIAADRVEVLRGSGSSLYGTNAAAGVVNIVSSEGTGPTHGMIQGEGGNMGFFRARTQSSGGLGPKAGYSAGLMHLNVTRGVDGNDAARNTSGQGVLRYNLAQRTTLTGRYMGSDDFVQNNVSPTATGIPAANIPQSVIVPAKALSSPQVDKLLQRQPVDYTGATYIPGIDDPDNRRTSRHQIAALKLNQVFTSEVSLQTSYQYVRTARVFANGPAGIGFQPVTANYSHFLGGIHTIDTRVDLQHSSANRLAVGYEFEHERYFEIQDNNLPGSQRIRTETAIRQRANAAYVQNQTSLVDGQLQLSLSGRVQFFRLSNPVFQAAGVPSPYDHLSLEAPARAVTADMSLSYFIPSASTKLRVHAGNAYRAPGLFERFGGGFFPDFVTGQVAFSAYGDPYLTPDRYNSVDGGIDQYLFRDRVRMSATYFYSRVVTITAFDLGANIRSTTDRFGRSQGYINGSGGISRGLELSVTARPAASLNMNGGYTYVRAGMDRDLTVPGFWRVLAIPRHTLTLAVSQTIGSRAVIAFDLVGVSEVFGNFRAAGQQRAYAYSGYAKADVSGSYLVAKTEPGELKATARVENILNRKFYEIGWLAPGTTFVTGLSLQF